MEIFIYFGHSIARGIHNELYYLTVVVGGKNFQWNLPTSTSAKPEELVQEFVRLTSCKISRIWCDNEFPRSHSFDAWVRNSNISICPSAQADYNHLLHARAENSQRISKEHVRSALKQSNAPLRLWPFASKHFCSQYRHWPGQDWKTGWDQMGDTDLHPDPASDLVPWGCYVTGHLQREHREVSDTTNSDRALEGAFMGWHDTAPLTFWMYCFKHQKVIRMCDPSFRQHLYPFADPACL
eukprot:3896416-Rhodomonas_salina.1